MGEIMVCERARENYATVTVYDYLSGYTRTVPMTESSVVLRYEGQDDVYSGMMFVLEFRDSLWWFSINGQTRELGGTRETVSFGDFSMYVPEFDVTFDFTGLEITRDSGMESVSSMVACGTDIYDYAYVTAYDDLSMKGRSVLLSNSDGLRYEGRDDLSSGLMFVLEFRDSSWWFSICGFGMGDVTHELGGTEETVQFGDFSMYVPDFDVTFDFYGLTIDRASGMKDVTSIVKDGVTLWSRN